jgi:hypothetical protein
MFGKKGSKILKLPVRNCFTLAMTNKLVVIINSTKYQKLRKLYYMKWNFLYQITAASRTPDYGTTAPRSPFSLSSVLNWICWPPSNKIPGYATVLLCVCEAHNYSIFFACHVHVSDRSSKSSSWAPILYVQHTYLPVCTRPTSILSDSRLRCNKPPSWVNTYPRFRR